MNSRLESPFRIPLAFRAGLGSGNKQGGKVGNYGAFAFLLTLTSLFLMSFILTEYSALAPLFPPTIIILVVGLWGFVFALISMKLRAGRFVLTLTLAVVLGLAGVFLLSSFSNILARGAGLTVLGIPLWVEVLFFGAVGVMETNLFQGVQGFLRKFWAPTRIGFVLLMVFMFVGGIVWHQAISRQILQGSIFSSPGYAIFVGGAWVLFALLFEFTNWIDTAIMTHFVWNVIITLAQAGAL